MHFTEVLYKGMSPLKKFTNYKNPGFVHKLVRIPALKDEVKSQKMKTGDGALCVNEMALMMDCWKRSDFNSHLCSAETQAFMACLDRAKVAQREAKEREAKGLPLEGSHLRPSKQVNSMLAKYPQPESNLKHMLKRDEKPPDTEMTEQGKILSEKTRPPARRKKLEPLKVE